MLIWSLTKQSIQESSDQQANENDINVNSVLAALVEQKRVQYGNSIQIHFSCDVQNIILKNIDLIEFERSVSNLVNNAIEASNEGSLVTVELAKNDEFVKIQIKDNGHGITPENLKKLGIKGFTANKVNGTGIGIFYAKQFVEQLGGKLIAQSVVGQRTVVSLVLPGVVDNLI